MNDWKWVPLDYLYVIHDRQIREYGGTPGTRDLALLESGYSRAINRANYEDPDVFGVAAAYAYGIAKAHAFVDGNKRTAFVAAFMFLEINNVSLQPDPDAGVKMMEDLAADRVSEQDFAVWLRELDSSHDLDHSGSF